MSYLNSYGKISILTVSIIVALSIFLDYFRSEDGKTNSVHLEDIAKCERMWNKTVADDIINSYIYYRKLGYSQSYITKEIFKANLPNAEKEHCYPFVCDLVFRAFADVIFEEGGITSKKEIRHMEDGDVVYVHVSYLHLFSRDVLPKIEVPFILITRRSDKAIPQNDTVCKSILENRHLIKWFALNPNPDYSDNPKVAGMPLGIQNIQGLKHIERLFMKGPPPPVYNSDEYLKDSDSAKRRPILLYMNYRFDRPDRPEFTEIFKSVATIHMKSDNESHFLEHLAKSKFVLSPRGGGIDCFRTYQALLLQAIPVVQDISPVLTEAVFRQAATFVLPVDWKSFRASARTFEEFVANDTMGRSVMLAEYWFDVVNRVRQRHFLTRHKQRAIQAI